MFEVEICGDEATLTITLLEAVSASDDRLSWKHVDVKLTTSNLRGSFRLSLTVGELFEFASLCSSAGDQLNVEYVFDALEQGLSMNLRRSRLGMYDSSIVLRSAVNSQRISIRMDVGPAILAKAGSIMRSALPAELPE